MRDNAPSRLKDREPIYLDYNATTPIDATVVEAMEPFLREHYGNPSSAHAYGHAARDAVENARRQVAALVRASSAEIVFTSGGSECPRKRQSRGGRRGVEKPTR